MTLFIIINFFSLSQNVHNIFIITEEAAIGSWYEKHILHIVTSKHNFLLDISRSHIRRHYFMPKYPLFILVFLSIPTAVLKKKKFLCCIFSVFFWDISYYDFPKLHSALFVWIQAILFCTVHSILRDKSIKDLNIQLLHHP